MVKDAVDAWIFFLPYDLFGFYGTCLNTANSNKT